MISDNLLPIAMFVFFIMFIGLILTFVEFRFGEPKRQQDQADKEVSEQGSDHSSQ